MKTILFYDYWQMECCGEPFKIGDKVSWYVVSANNHGKSLGIDNLDYFYDAHSNDEKNLCKLEGTIESISIYYVKYKLVDGEHHNMYVPIPNTNKLVESDNSNVKELKIGEHEVDGYLIELKDAIVRPINK